MQERLGVSVLRGVEKCHLSIVNELYKTTKIFCERESCNERREIIN